MNEENLQPHIDAILANLDEQHTHEAGPPRPTTDEREAPYQQHTIIDVYVIERQQDEEPPIVESTLDSVPWESQDNEEPEISTTLPRESDRTHTRWFLVAVVVLCTLIIGVGTSIYLLQLFTPSANITLMTASKQITTNNTVQVVMNGNADQAKNQVPGRVLPAITMSQQKAVHTTGMTRQSAQEAHGFITFYNAAPYVQTVEAGTLLTGVDGVQVTTDQAATIPAALMPTEGQVSVSAHTIITGTQGNIKAEDIYGGCCRLNVFVVSGEFHGGQDARTYQTVTQQDIASVVITVNTSLEQSIQAALQTQIQPSETLLTPLSCTSKVTSNHKVGEEAAQVQVTIDETCTGTTYITQALTTLATQRATQDANIRLGTGYTTTGVQTRITQAYTTNHGNSELEITSVSLWAYPFTQEQQDTIKAMIAGMSKDKATMTLLHLTGVQSVSISLKSGTDLPADAQYIHLLFLQV